jgi:hypothetical protein
MEEKVITYISPTEIPNQTSYNMPPIKMNPEMDQGNWQDFTTNMNAAGYRMQLLQPMEAALTMLQRWSGKSQCRGQRQGIT